MSRESSGYSVRSLILRGRFLGRVSWTSGLASLISDLYDPTSPSRGAGGFIAPEPPPPSGFNYCENTGSLITSTHLWFSLPPRHDGLCPRYKVCLPPVVRRYDSDLHGAVGTVVAVWHRSKSKVNDLLGNPPRMHGPRTNSPISGTVRYCGNGHHLPYPRPRRTQDARPLLCHSFYPAAISPLSYTHSHGGGFI